MNIKKLISNDNVRKGALYTLFSFINNGISFVLLLILARYLLPSDYGFLNLYNTFVQIVSIIIALGTNPYIANVYFQRNREDLKSVILIVLFITVIVTLILTIIITSFPRTSSDLIGISINYLWIALIICFFQCLTNINLDIWRLEERPVTYGIFSTAIAIFNFIITFFFIITLKYGWQGRVYSQLIVASVFFFLSTILMFRRGYLEFKMPSKLLIIETLAYGLPLVPHMISFWLKQGMDRYIINYFHGADGVGLYSFALNFAAIITIIGTAFNSNNSVYMFKKLSTGYLKAKHSLNLITRWMLLIFFLSFILVAISSIFLIPILLPKYTHCTKYILPLCLGAFFQCLYLLFVNYLFYYKKTKQLMTITISTAILQLILSLWLTRYSVLYTAYISMGITLLTMLLVKLQANKIFKTCEINVS